MDHCISVTRITSVVAEQTSSVVVACLQTTGFLAERTLMFVSVIASHMGDSIDQPFRRTNTSDQLYSYCFDTTHGPLKNRVGSTLLDWPGYAS